MGRVRFRYPRSAGHVVAELVGGFVAPGYFGPETDFSRFGTKGIQAGGVGGRGGLADHSDDGVHEKQWPRERDFAGAEG